ncbi:AbrB/MazE/SpoVT family DNA-binding domain-containing protein [Mesorhizobium sp. WSM4935]|uniref:AbrB/MazE/SpoVT family DNA-binding domain-containing protein n=1 Tax=Mesorhizobium sp. WSM4935 TaxID=3038547 RepID=UPI0024156756|nr:AbrB/MazE/SpoVT family DNA-binding domain-containing protein [Mesorhizobium sp. WSM4935]MDG4876424.1 AbrB/MazE/SpoVT family DNA-binding domain-containing protein [Mesorhizobium sp. WSM4935]
MLDSLDLQVGDELQIIETDGGLILRPARDDNPERQMTPLAMSWTDTRLHCGSLQSEPAANSRPCRKA